MKNAANMDAQMQARMNEYLNSGVNMDQPAANNNKQMFQKVNQMDGTALNAKKPQSDGRVIRK